MSSTSLLPNWNHFISLETAQAMTLLYRTEKENILATEYQNQDILCISETFNREAFDAVLAQEGCVGLRVYFGMETDFKIRAIIVGVYTDNSDMLPPAGSPARVQENNTDEDDNKIIEIGRPCPDFCAEEPHL